MLSKKVCHICHAKTWGRLSKAWGWTVRELKGLGAENIQTNIDTEWWGERQEKKWNEGWVSCFHSGRTNLNGDRILEQVSTKGEPPSDCPFYLEHRVEVQ